MKAVVKATGEEVDVIQFKGFWVAKFNEKGTPHIKYQEKMLEFPKGASAPLARPKANLGTVDLSKIVATCESYLDEVEERGAVDSDLPHYLFEEVMKALYGDNVFKWINSRL